MQHSKILIAVFVSLSLILISCNSNSTNPTVVGDRVALTAEDNKAVIDREISSWEAAKTRSYNVLQDIYADDFTAYFGKNILSKAQTIATFKAATVNSYRLSNIQTKPVAKDVVVIYYQLDQDIVGTDGVAWFPKVASSSVYVKRNGAWKNVFYHETPMST